jgi:glycerone phosphate O-acyltransferase
LGFVDELSVVAGFLSMALMPFLTGRVPDITIVPINISYDRTLEEILFAYELLGVPKPKESTSVS